MCIKDVMVQNQVGLHARPATFFIQKANEFRSAIWIEKEERRVNAKSLLGILSLGIVGGTAIRIIADGTDEEQAVAVAVLVEEKFICARGVRVICRKEDMVLSLLAAVPVLWAEPERDGALLL